MASLTPPCTPINTTTASVPGGSPKRRGSFLVSINSLFARLRRQSGGATKKEDISSPKSHLAKPKQLFVNLSNKKIQFRHKNSKKVDEEFEGEAELDFGDGGLWQRNILMGDRCQPLDFSGVIYYDSNGKQLSELPMKSPRASPLSSYTYASSEKH